MESQSRGTR
jgi:hypothetical protein